MNSPSEMIDWQRVCLEHKRWLTTVLRARGVEAGSLDDAWQEVQMAAVAHADRLRDPDRLAPWLYRIAITCALQHRRRLGRRRKLSESYARDYIDRLSQTEPDPLDWLLADEQRRLVRQAIEHLPSRDAELLLLKYTEDWSYRQLAEHMGVSASAIEARLHRARERMRGELSRLSPQQLTY